MAITRDKPRFIKAPQSLRERAVNFDTGLDLELSDEVRARIEGVIAASSDAFASEVLEKLREMRQQVKQAEGDELSRIFIMSKISELAFDIKGMGGTFGYPLLTHLAKSLKDFIARLGLPDLVQLEVISIHIDAMYVVLANGIHNQGGKTEQRMMEVLQAAVEKVQRA